jgi:mannose/fructose-specific phosphotransferase system component IIA
VKCARRLFGTHSVSRVRSSGKVAARDSGIDCQITGYTEAVYLGTEESPDSLYAKVLEAMGRLGDEVVVLVDLPGGAPANVCMCVPAERGCEAVVGVNLPMLIETVLSCDDESAIAVAQTALQAGQEELIHLRELLPKPGSG